MKDAIKQRKIRIVQISGSGLFLWFLAWLIISFSFHGDARTLWLAIGWIIPVPIIVGVVTICAGIKLIKYWWNDDF